METLTASLVWRTGAQDKEEHDRKYNADKQMHHTWSS